MDSTFSSASIELHPADWKYLNEGYEHYILGYIGSNPHLADRVLILHKYDKKYATSELQKKCAESQLILSKAYNRIILAYPQLAVFLMKKTFLTIDESHKQQFLKDIQEQIEEHRDKTRLCTRIRPDSRLVIGRNLYHAPTEKHVVKTVWVEFKPKSNLYDMYTTKEIELLTDKHKLKPQALRELIESSPYSEKIKWYKKCLGVFNLKENNKLSPLELFEYRGRNYLENSRLTNYFPPGKDLPVTTYEFDGAINEVLKRSDLFRIVLIMQLLYHKPWDLLRGHDFMEITKDLDLTHHMDIIEKKLISWLHYQHAQFKEGSHLGGKQVVEASLGQDIIEEMFRFLAMTTWRDVSLIMYINIASKEDADKLKEDREQATFKQRINEQYWCQCTLTIIDYELKQISRIAGNVSKDEKLTTAYILSKTDPKFRRQE